MRPGHGQLVEEHEELPEGLEEWPSGQQADALVGVDGSVGDHLLLHCGDNAQLDLLLLAQQLHRVRLVELDRGTVDLQPARKQNTQTHTRVRVFKFLTSEDSVAGCSPSLRRRWSGRTWRRRARGLECWGPSTQSWLPWANRRAGPTRTEGTTRNPPPGSEKSDLRNDGNVKDKPSKQRLPVERNSERVFILSPPFNFHFILSYFSDYSCIRVNKHLNTMISSQVKLINFMTYLRVKSLIFLFIIIYLINYNWTTRPTCDISLDLFFNNLEKMSLKKLFRKIPKKNPTKFDLVKFRNKVKSHLLTTTTTQSCFEFILTV